MKIKTLIFASLLQGCASSQVEYYVGIGVHSERFDAPEITLENPVCEFGVQGREGSFGISYHHISACFVTEEGYGYNGLTTRFYF